MPDPRLFESIFGSFPSVGAIAPGRINLIGEHIDYLGGCVLPIAIDRSLTITAARSRGSAFEIWPEGYGLEKPAVIQPDENSPRTDPADSWLNYIIGVISGYRDAGIDAPPFQAVITSTLPTGAGLSSSAALETGIALVIEALTGVEQDPVDRALLCQRAEHRFAGVPCGTMDQLAVGACHNDHALLINCADLSLRHIPFPKDVTVITADTGVKHALRDGEYRKRREECEEACRILSLDSLLELRPEQLDDARQKLDDTLYRRTRHAVTEMQRVGEVATALSSGDLPSLASLLRAGHDSIRDDYEVSCEELDFLVGAAYEFGTDRGLIGARMTGGGFGGSTVNLVRNEAAEALKTHLEKSYEEKFGRKADCFITSAADGAHTVSIQST